MHNSDTVFPTGKILIIEDTQTVAYFIQAVLKKDYTVQVAHNGEEGLEKVRQFRPDILLLDVVMPGISGLEVCARIRKDPDLNSLKIIMISSYASLKERMKGYTAGADDYLGKPFDKDELLAKVRVFLRLKSVEDQLQVMNEKLHEQVRIRTEQLIDAEKMAAIGKATAGIVHNLNNPLQAILGYSQLLEMQLPDTLQIHKLKDAATLMRDMIATILTTSKEVSSTRIQEINLNALIQNQLEMMRTNPFYKHQVQTDLDLQPIPRVKGAVSHFIQSLDNLLKNAVDSLYFSETKQLFVQTRSDEKEIHIVIADTGCGMDAPTMEKIFDPFFTTKPLSSQEGEPTGTGIGLASTQKMIQSYGGNIQVESKTGVGSTFTVILPFSAEKT